MQNVVVTALSLFVLAMASEAAEIRSAGKDAIPGSYIVVLKENAVFSEAHARGGWSAVADAASSKVQIHGGKLKHVYGSALRGFAVQLSAEQAKRLADDPDVDYIEEDQVVHAVGVESPATWGLDRVDQRDLPLNSTYVYNQTGFGVNAYIIDTGLRATHLEFLGRVGNGSTAINDGRGTDDCNGHGTHVSGTVGGTTYGVAKLVTLHPVRVLDCGGSGSISGVIAGVDWVTANRVIPAVANMSLGGGASSALDTAVNNSITSGVTYAVAAGNSSANACSFSPARVPAALTVGATTRTDQRASYSNFGSCLDLFAPGSSITSAWNASDTATNTISGTSMATPHVTGAAALYLEINPFATPAIVSTAIKSYATPSRISRAGHGSPNLLLYTLR